MFLVWSWIADQYGITHVLTHHVGTSKGSWDLTTLNLYLWECNYIVKQLVMLLEGTLSRFGS